MGVKADEEGDGVGVLELFLPGVRGVEGIYV